MRRIMVTLAACVSVLAVALSAAPAGAAADPAPPPGTSTSTSKAAAGYDDCPAGYSCYFDGLNGTGAFIIADHGCDYIDLLGTGWENRISSIYNRGSSKVFVYTGRGTSFDVHGWMPVGQRGNYNTNDIDGILVGC